MSRFLSAIHYFMYNKIKYLDWINRDLLEKFDIEEKREEVLRYAGSLEEGNLEDIINLENIHGWINQNISIVELGLAKTVDLILEKNNLDDIKNYFYKLGLEEGKKIEKPIQVFEKLNERFLDGMPCDRALELLKENEDGIAWRENLEIHSKFWKDKGVIYRELRNNFVKGLCKSYNLNYIDSSDIKEVKCTV